MKLDISFYKNKTVLITGHTGFKGTWLSKILINAGANVIGYSLSPANELNLFSLSNIESRMISVIGDIRDYHFLYQTLDKYKPEIVFHLAAQPLVLESYINPKYTYETNVMGTLNLLECIRLSSFVKSFVNITTDKVYENNDLYDHAFRENEPLNGHDPYSNSKSCTELLTHSYKKAFFMDGHCTISTARAGNVIGGGDFSNNRIIPDAIRSIMNGKSVFVRNPNSIRPYQHVLEPLYAYLLIAQAQYFDVRYADSYNVGPRDFDCVTTAELMTKFCNAWGNDLHWYTEDNNGPHEANFLKLNCDKISLKLNWKPKWNLDTAIEKIVEWTQVYLHTPNEIWKIMDSQIEEYEKG